MPVDILLVITLRALVQIAALMLIGRGVLWLFGPRARQGNFVYDLLTIGTMPFTKLARKISPRFVPDAHVPWVAFFLLFWLYVGLGFAKLALCASHGIDCKQLAQ
jgi:hypothetical protein